MTAGIFFLQGIDATQFLTDLDYTIGDEEANDYIDDYSDLFSNPAPISGKI